MTDRTYVDHGPAVSSAARCPSGLTHELAPGTVLLEPEEVVTGVSAALKVALPELRKEGRYRSAGHVAEARYAAFWLLRRHTRLSLGAVARLLGGRDHSAVIRGIRRCEERRAADAWFREVTNKLERELEEKANGTD